ncbi:MAG: hypothetical protein QXH39_04795 [Conexivisphaerales archaeon]
MKLEGNEPFILNAIANLYFALLEFILGIFVILLKGNSIEVGITYALYNLSWFISSSLCGFAVDRNHLRDLLYSGVIVLSAGLFGIGFASSIVEIYYSVFTMGVGASFISVGLLVYVGAKGGINDASLYGKLMLYSIIGSGIGGFIGFISLLISQFTELYIASIKAIFLIFGIVTISGIYLVYRFPQINLNALKSNQNGGSFREIAGILVSVMLLGLGQGITYPMMVPYVEARFHATPFELLLVYIPAGIGWFFASRSSGKVINKYGESRKIFFVTLVSAFIAFLLPFAPDLIVLSVLWGVEAVGLALWTILVQQRISKKMPSKIWGISYGFMNGLYYLLYATGSFSGGRAFYYLGPMITFWAAAAVFALVPLPININHKRENVEASK